MSNRQLRRAAEREARRLAVKQAPSNSVPAPAMSIQPDLARAAAAASAAPQVTPSAIQHSPYTAPPAVAHSLCAEERTPPLVSAVRGTNGSTGPITPEGKAISSQNNFRHGLTAAFKVLASESQLELGSGKDPG